MSQSCFFSAPTIAISHPKMQVTCPVESNLRNHSVHIDNMMKTVHYIFLSKNCFQFFKIYVFADQNIKFESVKPIYYNILDMSMKYINSDLYEEIYPAYLVKHGQLCAIMRAVEVYNNNQIKNESNFDSLTAKDCHYFLLYASKSSLQEFGSLNKIFMYFTEYKNTSKIVVFLNTDLSTKESYE